MGYLPIALKMIFSYYTNNDIALETFKVCIFMVDIDQYCAK